jgi:hypothetical protein
MWQSQLSDLKKHRGFMKALLMYVALLLLVGVVGAQDGYAAYPYQANPLCPFRIVLTAADAVPYYQLKFDESIVERGSLAAGESVEMRLSQTDQWYILLIESEGAYTVDTDMGCDAPDETTPTPSPELMAIWERAQERVMAFRQSIFGEP